jgi:hypothetical protein
MRGSKEVQATAQATSLVSGLSLSEASPMTLSPSSSFNALASGFDNLLDDSQATRVLS